MITINSYLDKICSDFQDYLNANVCLCDLKEVHYDAGRVPDYSNIHNQQYYLLRYAYAYAFEYKCMYAHLLKLIPVTSVLDVMSVGCGNMIDYWALAQAVRDDVSINYKGYDSVDWSYKFSKRAGDKTRLIFGDALDAIESLDYFDSDIIVFPKSISEFSYDGIGRICNCLEEKEIRKDRFSLLVSLRSDRGSQERDMAKVAKLYDAIIAAGYSTDTNVATVTSFSYPDKKIREIDPSFSHPSKTIDLLKELAFQCKHFKENDTNCEPDCVKRLNRWPMISCRSMKWQHFDFVRG